MNYHNNSSFGGYLVHHVHASAKKGYCERKNLSVKNSPKMEEPTNEIVLTDQDILQLLNSSEVSLWSQDFGDDFEFQGQVNSVSSNSGESFGDSTTSPATEVTVLSPDFNSEEDCELLNLSSGDFEVVTQQTIDRLVPLVDDPVTTISVAQNDPGPDPDESANGTTKCSVCKEAAGKHSYYGGRVCPSCRAFFRRAVQSKYFEIFFCSRGDEKCEINLKTRRSCQFCRFKKCLESGMRIAWVLPDGERQRRFDKFQKTAVHNKFNKFVPATESRSNFPMVKEPILKLTIEEKSQLKQMSQNLNLFGKNSYLKTLLGNQQHLYHLIRVCYTNFKVPYDSWKYMTEMCDTFSKELLYQLQEMSRLPIVDRNNLVKFNTPIMFTYKIAAQIGEEGQGLASILPEAQKSGKFPLIQTVMKDFNLGPEHQPRNITYDQIMVSPWAANIELEERHKYLFTKMKEWSLATDEYKNLRVDDILSNLMRFILAFTPDFLPLERRDICDELVQNNTMLMYRYLKEFYPKTGSRKFAESMAVVAYAREATEIYQKRLHV